MKSFDENNLSVNLLHKIDSNQILSYLALLDDAFEPPLSSFLDIQAYAIKLFNYASILVVNYNNLFVGLCAFYINKVDENDIFCYVTCIAVTAKFKNKGFGVILLNYLDSHLLKLNIYTIKLEVKRDNINAIHFYLRHNFVLDQSKIQRDDSLYLIKRLSCSS